MHSEAASSLAIRIKVKCRDEEEITAISLRKKNSKHSNKYN